MTNYDLSKPVPNATEFHVLRATAIDDYAYVEQALAYLLSVVIGPDPRTGGTILYRISNAKSRLLIIESLIENRYGPTYDHFLNGIPKTEHKSGLISLLHTLDGARNEIVHWHAHVDVSENTYEMRLAPPNFWAGSETRRTTEDLSAFSAKARFVSRVVNMFATFLAPETADPATVSMLQAWREIFQRPCTYPPSSTHPLSQNDGDPPFQPQSFRLTLRSVLVPDQPDE